MENIKGWKTERKNQLNQKKTELNDLINEIALLKNSNTSDEINTLLNEIAILKIKLSKLYKYEITLNEMEKHYNPLSWARLRAMSNRIIQDTDINKNIIYNKEIGKMFILKRVNDFKNNKEVISINNDVYKYEDNKFYQLDQNIPDELFIKETRNHLSSYYINNTKKMHYPKSSPVKDHAYEEELKRDKEIQRAEKEFASEYAMMVRMCTPTYLDKD